MQIRLHKNATTTPALRKLIQNSDLSERKLAQKYRISRATVRKWKKRGSSTFTMEFLFGVEPELGLQ